MGSACYVTFVSALCLALTAGPMPTPASAQSAARPAELTGALLSLQQEFVETVHKATPELRSLQKDLVETLHTRLTEMKAEYRVGQRSIEEIISAIETYYRELETLQVMEARSSKKATSERALLRVRIDVRSRASSELSEFSRACEDRFKVGEIRQADVAAARAKALKAVIMLAALKSAAGR